MSDEIFEPPSIPLQKAEEIQTAKRLKKEKQRDAEQQRREAARLKVEKEYESNCALFLRINRFFACREREKLETIREEGWVAIDDNAVQAIVKPVGAQLRTVFTRGIHTSYEIFQIFFVAWLERFILPELNSALHQHRLQASEGRKKFFAPATSKDLTCYFMNRFLRALRTLTLSEKQEHKLITLRHTLIGKNRAKALKAALGFGDHKVEIIISSLHSYLQEFIAAGPTFVVDETIFGHFGKPAAELRRLRFIPGKPHDYGLFSYTLSQRFIFSQIPVLLDLIPTWLLQSDSPDDAVLRFVRRHFAAGASQHWIADSLYCKPQYLRKYVAEGLRFSLTSKANAGKYLSPLVNLASSDLPLMHARTYRKGDLFTQVTSTSEAVTVVVSNNFVISEDAPSAKPTLGPYKFALYMFRLLTSTEIMALGKLGQAYADFSKAKLVHHITGWDFLREELRQAGVSELTYERAQKMKKDQLVAIHQTAAGAAGGARSMSKAELLADLFPAESPLPAGESRKQKRKRDVLSLQALREQVRGESTMSHKIYDHWNADYDAVDKINERYGLSYHVPGGKDFRQYGLESVAFLMAATSRSIEIEYNTQREYEQSGGSLGHATFEPEQFVKWLKGIAECLVAEK
jgi:hypothetical protein